MAFSQQDIQLIKKAKQEGKTKEQALAQLVQSRQKIGGGSLGSPQPERNDLFARIGSDMGEDFRGIGEDAVSQFSQAGKNIVDTAQDKNLSLPEKALGIGAEAFKRGGRFIGNTLLGGAKLATTPEFEQKVVDVAQGIGETVAETETVQDLITKYKGLSEDEKQGVQNALGFAEGAAELFGAGRVTSGLKSGIETAATVGARGGKDLAESFVDTAGKTVRGFRDATGNLVDSTGRIIQPATDIATGGARQVGQFAKRTARSVQDTAEQARVLKTLPEPEANLLRTGVNDSFVNTVKQAPVSEVGIYQDLIAQAKKKVSDPTPNTSQPKVLVGEEFLKPVDYLVQQRNTVGGALGDIRKGLSTKKTINTNASFKKFHEYLRDDLGLIIGEKGVIKTGSGRVAQSDIKEIQKIYSELRSKTFASPKEIDEFLQRTFKEFDLRQAREKTFGDDVTRVAERARSIVRQSMPDDYNALATQYAEIVKPLQDTAKLLGYKGNIADLTTKQLKAGEVALRVLGNAADRPQSVIDAVLNTAEGLGYVSDVNLNRVIYFVDQLEDLYDITPTRSFSGSTARGVDQSAVGAMGDAARLNVGGLLDKALSSKATQQEVQDALDAFIQSLSS